jgi:hypothetical protein
MLGSPANTAPDVLIRAGNWRERRHALTSPRRARLGAPVSTRSPTLILDGIEQLHQAAS